MQLWISIIVPKVYCKNRINFNICYKISNFLYFAFPMGIFDVRIAPFFRFYRKVYFKIQG